MYAQPGWIGWGDVTVPRASLRPRLLAHASGHRHEPDGQDALLDEVVPLACEHDQLLQLLADGEDEPAPVAELLLEGLGDPRRRRRDRDRVEGCGLGPAQIAVPGPHRHVGVA